MFLKYKIKHYSDIRTRNETCVHFFEPNCQLEYNRVAHEVAEIILKLPRVMIMGNTP